MRVTRADVAKEANVSTATVSYVLNNTHNLPEETRNRVLDAVEKLGYKPDMIARSMATNKTRQLAIVMDSLLNPYYGEITLGFENAAVQAGYFINICSGQNNLDEYFDSFVSRRLDGIMLLALPDKFHIQNLYKLIDSGVKIIMGDVDDIDVSRISMLDNNYYEGMKLAYEHLYRLGHREIVYLDVMHAQPGYEKVNDREKAFLECQKKYLGDIKKESIISFDSISSDQIEKGMNTAQKLIASGKSFTAVICTNDLVAIGAIQAFASAGLKVPQDVSIVGFDNIIYGKNWSPSITSVFHDKVKFGKTAFDILNNNINNNVTGFYKADVTLYNGASTAPPKK